MQATSSKRILLGREEEIEEGFLSLIYIPSFKISLQNFRLEVRAGMQFYMLE